MKVFHINFFERILLPIYSSYHAQTYYGLALYLFLAAALCSLLATLAYIFSLSSVQDSEKRSEYECGFEPFDSATRLPFDVHFYLVGILFLIFDVEIALLFPWVLSLRTCGWFGFYLMLGFILLLAVGFLYEWKRGALIWPSRQKEQPYFSGSTSGASAFMISGDTIGDFTPIFDFHPVTWRTVYNIVFPDHLNASRIVDVTGDSIGDFGFLLTESSPLTIPREIYEFFFCGELNLSRIVKITGDTIGDADFAPAGSEPITIPIEYDPFFSHVNMAEHLTFARDIVITIPTHLIAYFLYSLVVASLTAFIINALLAHEDYEMCLENSDFPTYMNPTHYKWWSIIPFFLYFKYGVVTTVLACAAVAWTYVLATTLAFAIVWPIRLMKRVYYAFKPANNGWDVAIKVRGNFWKFVFYSSFYTLSTWMWYELLFVLERDFWFILILIYVHFFTALYYFHYDIIDFLEDLEEKEEDAKEAFIHKRQRARDPNAVLVFRVKKKKRKDIEKEKNYGPYHIILPTLSPASELWSADHFSRTYGESFDSHWHNLMQLNGPISGLFSPDHFNRTYGESFDSHWYNLIRLNDGEIRIHRYFNRLSNKDVTLYQQIVDNLLPELIFTSLITGILAYLAIQLGKDVDKFELAETCLRYVRYAIIVLLISGFIFVPGARWYLFNGYVFTAFPIVWIKAVTVFATLILSFNLKQYFSTSNRPLLEFPLVLALSLLFLLFLLSSSHLFTAFLSIVGFSLNTYVLIFFEANRSATARESGIKYFYLSAFSSGLIIYGIFLIFLVFGTGHLMEIRKILACQPELLLNGLDLLRIGIAFLLFGLFFKLSAFPGHLWAPEVYDGAPDAVMGFFMVPVKVAVLTFVIFVLGASFDALSFIWQPLVVLSAVASLIWGCFAAFFELKTKRFLAYASINQMGFLLIGIASGTIEGYRATLIYLFFYVAINLIFLIVFLNTRRSDGLSLIYLTDFRRLAETNWSATFFVALALFSIAGIPPLAGFFGKYYLLLYAQEQGLYGLVIVALATSLISTYYYLRLIKIFWFENGVGVRKVTCRISIGQFLNISLLSAGLLTFIYFSKNLLEFFDLITICMLGARFDA